MSETNDKSPVPDRDEAEQIARDLAEMAEEFLLERGVASAGARVMLSWAAMFAASAHGQLAEHYQHQRTMVDEFEEHQQRQRRIADELIERWRS